MFEKKYGIDNICSAKLALPHELSIKSGKVKLPTTNQPTQPTIKRKAE